MGTFHLTSNQGELDKWSDIYQSHFDMLNNFGLKLCQDECLVEDIIQDLFVDLLRLYESPEDLQNVKVYLFKSLRREIFRELSKQRILFDKGGLPENGEFFTTYSIEKDWIQDEELKSRREFLVQALNSLTPRQKEAIHLKYECNLDYPEIASILNVNIETCRTLIYRSIKKMRDQRSELDTRGNKKKSLNTSLFIKKMLLKALHSIPLFCPDIQGSFRIM